MSGLNKSRRRQGQILTVGQVARMCDVAPRTATKWCDKGLLKYYRIPGGKDRRIQRVDFVAFLRANEMPIPVELDSVSAAFVLTDDRELRERAERICSNRIPLYVSPSAVRLGMVLARDASLALLVDAWIGRDTASSIVREAAEEKAIERLALAVGEDQGCDSYETRLIRRPLRDDELAAFLTDEQ